MKSDVDIEIVKLPDRQEYRRGGWGTLWLGRHTWRGLGGGQRMLFPARSNLGNQAELVGCERLQLKNLDLLHIGVGVIIIVKSISIKPGYGYISKTQSVWYVN